MYYIRRIKFCVSTYLRKKFSISGVNYNSISTPKTLVSISCLEWSAPYQVNNIRFWQHYVFRYLYFLSIKDYICAFQDNFPKFSLHDSWINLVYCNRKFFFVDEVRKSNLETLSSFADKSLHFFGPFLCYVITFLFFFGPTHPPTIVHYVSINNYSTERQQKLPFSEPTQSFCWRNIGMGLVSREECLPRV